MIGQIFHITHLGSNSQYPAGTWKGFQDWFLAQKCYQIDIETDITDWWYNKTLISIQFGSCTAQRVQWFLQWSELTPEQQRWLIDQLNRDRRMKLAHGAIFEYLVLRFTIGVILENIYDTMLAEKVLEGGLETIDYALADISWKYLRIRMNKEQQSNFGDNIMNDEKILYGITDVAYLDIVKWQQIEDGTKKDLLNVIALENEVLPAFGDMTYEGLLLDKEKWRENLRWAEGELIPAIEKLNKWLLHPDMAWLAVEKGYVSNKDRVTINYASHQQRTELLKLVFPDIIGGTMAIVAKYVRDNARRMIAEMGEEPAMHLLTILDKYYEKNYEPLQKELLANHREYLIANGYLIPAGESTINWNSPDQALPLAQCLVPKLKGMSEEERDKHSHPFLKDYARFKEFNKLCTDMGEEWIRKYISPDGRVRTTFRQVMSTGRVSSVRPNMQNITVRESVGTRYRNAFIAEEGWEFVSADYISQELVFIATLSQEPAWINTLREGKDLHSVLAEVVYGTKWKEAAEADCEYYKLEVGPDGKMGHAQLKCNCKKHKPLRYNVKTVNFMLA